MPREYVVLHTSHLKGRVGDNNFYSSYIEKLFLVVGVRYFAVYDLINIVDRHTHS